VTITPKHKLKTGAASMRISTPPVVKVLPVGHRPKRQAVLAGPGEQYRVSQIEINTKFAKHKEQEKCQEGQY
jgi:hypothetical protein